MKKSFKHIFQNNEMECGPVCLQMVLTHFGYQVDLEDLKEISYLGIEGTSLNTIKQAGIKSGLESKAFLCDIQSLREEAPLPVIAHWNEHHFVVIYKTSKKYIYIADPALGKIKLSDVEFKKHFYSKDDSGYILTCQPSDSKLQKEIASKEKVSSWRYLLNHLFQFKPFLIQILIAIGMAGLLSIGLPILSQALVDDGIIKGDFYFLKVVLVSQVVLFFGKLAFDVFRNWIVLHLNFRVGISMISRYLNNLLGLSASKVSIKTSGDVLQRIDDYRAVEHFLSDGLTNSLLFVLNFGLSSILLFVYSANVFYVFVLGTSLSVLWILLFNERRRQVRLKITLILARNKEKIIDLIHGMMDIKMFGIEKRKVDEWEGIQIREYEAEMQNLRIENYQEVGFFGINELKNLVILFIAASAVLNGEISLGALLGISFVLGQVSRNASFIPQVFHSVQETKIGLDRIKSIEEEMDEDDSLRTDIPNGKIEIRNLTHTYDGDLKVLDKINFDIEKGKITAIVGESGSGKTTLFKLLTKFLKIQDGKILVDNTSLYELDEDEWRKNIGAVLQGGYLFPDTVSNNISLGRINDKERIEKMAKIACIDEYIASLRKGYSTMIGPEGMRMSEGQKQRILIARALCNNPDYVFFDEATSSLDTSNERQIHNNLNEYFIGRTVLIIAHRLSTVQNADNIIVLQKGRLVEQGTHQILIEKKGVYYNLIKDQLNLGS